LYFDYQLLCSASNTKRIFDSSWILVVGPFNRKPMLDPEYNVNTIFSAE